MGDNSTSQIIDTVFFDLCTMTDCKYISDLHTDKYVEDMKALVCSMPAMDYEKDEWLRLKKYLSQEAARGAKTPESAERQSIARIIDSKIAELERVK